MKMSEGITRPELPKRFYKTVDVEEKNGAFGIVLDGRAIKTPARRALRVPARSIAETLRAEWDAQGERIDPQTMPLTRLANSAIDGVADQIALVRDDLAKFVETDLLFYRAGGPERLVAWQSEGWDPIVKWAEKRLGVRFHLAEGVMHVAQPEASVAAFKAAVDRFDDPLDVAALHQMTTLTGSALLALAVAERYLDVEAAWSAAHLDEDWNIEMWGLDEEAAARRMARFAEMKVAGDIVTAPDRA